MNANLFNPLRSKCIYDFANNFLSRDFMIHIHNPTRFCPENEITKFSLLDHIWVKYPKVRFSSVINCEIADHLPTVAFLEPTNSQGKLNTNIKIDKRIYDAASIEQFKTEIENSVNNFNYTGEISTQIDSFVSNLYDLHNIFFPIKKISINKIKPWITHDLKVCIKKKAKMHESFRKGHCTRGHYRNYCNMLTSAIRIAKNMHYQRMFAGCKNDSKKMWQHLNKLKGGCGGKKRTPDKIAVDGKIIIDQKEIATEFNNYFRNAPALVKSNINQATSSYTHRIPRNIRAYIILLCTYYPK